MNIEIQRVRHNSTLSKLDCINFTKLGVAVRELDFDLEHPDLLIVCFSPERITGHIRNKLFKEWNLRYLTEH